MLRKRLIKLLDLLLPRMMMKLRSKRYRVDEPEMEFITELPVSDGLALDIGAHLGAYSWILSKRFKRVVAFEPEKKHFTRLRRGAPTNCECICTALSDTSGVASLYIPDYKVGLASLEQHDGFKDIINIEAVEVKKASLDSFNYTNVKFIKIDVEGHELSVLYGAKKLLSENSPIILIELDNTFHLNRHQAAITYLQRFGFLPYVYNVELKKLVDHSMKLHSKKNNLIFKK